MTSSLRMQAVSAGLACLPLARSRGWKVLIAGLLRIPAAAAMYRTRRTCARPPQMQRLPRSLPAIRAVFERFAEMGSARQVWLWFRSQGLRFPLQSNTLSDLRWVMPSYGQIHQVLSNPIYAGAYVYGKTHGERYVDEHGQVRKRTRRLPMSQWPVLIRGHHPGFIDWETFEANQTRLAQNTHPRPHQAGGAVREGAALLQGIASCGRCRRRLRVYYGGRNAAPGYHCFESALVNERRILSAGRWTSD